MKVVEIFKSIDGEGVRAGLPVTFIRLFGCNLRCSFCDTPYGYEGNDYVEMTAQEILDKVNELDVPRVTLTGGEPLIHEDVKTLLNLLDEYNYDVNIETNGSVDITKFIGSNKNWFTVDYKCNTSGMTDKMNSKTFANLRKNDVLKFVVGSQEDMKQAKEAIHIYQPICQIYFSPVFGMIDPKDIVDFILDNKLYNVHIQLQLHKLIWEPSKRGV